MSGETPPVSTEYLDVGRHRLYPHDGLWVYRNGESGPLYTIVEAQQTPPRGVILWTGDRGEGEGGFTFEPESAVIQQLADAEYFHWRRLATGTYCHRGRTDDTQFVCFLFAGATPTTDTLPFYLGVETASPPETVRPTDISNWIVHRTLDGVAAKALDVLADSVQRCPELGTTIRQVVQRGEVRFQRRRPHIDPSTGAQ